MKQYEITVATEEITERRIVPGSSIQSAARIAIARVTRNRGGKLREVVSVRIERVS